jgi:hypothetical protein
MVESTTIFSDHWVVYSSTYYKTFPGAPSNTGFGIVFKRATRTAFAVIGFVELFN